MFWDDAGVGVDGITSMFIVFGVSITRFLLFNSFLYYKYHGTPVTSILQQEQRQVGLFLGASLSAGIIDHWIHQCGVLLVSKRDLFCYNLLEDI